MKSKTIKLIAFAMLGLFGFSILNAPVTLAANYDVCSSGASDEVKKAAGCSGNANQLPDVIQGILNAIIAVSGIIAVVYVIIGGINYMTSNGDAGKLEKAKKTIFYAVIGLAVTTLAFAIVNWTIDAIKSNPGNYSDQTSCQNAGHTWDGTTCK